MTARTFVTLVILTVYMTPGMAFAAQPAALGTPHGGSAGRLQLPADELYAPRARRRFAAYLRLRLLEMRQAGLVRAAAVVERRLPVDELVRPLRRP
ncbi:MAG: hypothetical protein NVSMB19_03040 [Vulcanimicrobiaceae bacterium]